MGRETAPTFHQTLRLRRHARSSRLPELDRLKEQVAYLKLWQGITVVTFISLFGWLLSASTGAPVLTVVLAMSGVVLLAVVSIALHRYITSRIAEMRKL